MTKDAPVPFVDLAIQYRSIKSEIDGVIHDALARADFILGKDVPAFEQEFAAFVGARHCVGLSNGLDALVLALRALGVGRGDEVIVQANTYIATCLAISAVGATPVLVDCNAHDYMIDISAVERAITSRTRVIMPVHLTGYPADMAPLMALAQKHGLRVVEDAAQAQGTQYAGQPCGAIGDMGCFSFYPGKNLGAYGDAGGLTTNDAALAERVRQLQNYGQRVKYHHVVKGVNARLDTLQAAILRVKLRHLNGWNTLRRERAEQYQERLQGVGDVRFQTVSGQHAHIYHLMVIETSRRDALQQHLAGLGIGTIIHYPIPVHLQEAYQDLGHRRGDFPRAERLAETILSLPMFPEITTAQIDQVSDGVRSFFAGATR
jgi:dTDP-4-amino-4,6-dideoxygalactose transaminase